MLGFIASSFTPRNNSVYMSLGGADKITFFAPAQDEAEVFLFL